MTTENKALTVGLGELLFLLTFAFIAGAVLTYSFCESYERNKVPGKIEIKSKDGSVVGYADTSPRNMKPVDLKDGAYLCFAVFKNAEEY